MTAAIIFSVVFLGIIVYVISVIAKSMNAQEREVNEYFELRQLMSNVEYQKAVRDSILLMKQK